MVVVGWHMTNEEAINGHATHNVDVILFDHNISGTMTGLEACRILREQNSKCLTILLASEINGELLKLAKTCGVGACLLKCVDGMAFAGVISKLRAGNTRKS
jgi:DNA-binding NarL/FixJ family response regulator